MKTKIYVLCEPDGEIRYVGKTGNKLSCRLFAHLNYARQNGRGYCPCWIRSLFKIGRLPTIQLIGDVDGNGAKEEMAWIAYGKDEGWRLTNNSIGGESGHAGCKHSEEWKIKMSERLKGKKISETLKRNPVRYWLGKKRPQPNGAISKKEYVV